MAWDANKFTELGNLLAELQDQGGPIDKESPKYKKVEQLLKQLYQAFSRLERIPYQDSQCHISTRSGLESPWEHTSYWSPVPVKFPGLRPPMPFPGERE